LSAIVPEVQRPREPMPKRLGRYEIVRKLGQGGMGTVYLARDASLQRLVALKVIAGMREVGGSQFVRFQREAMAAARLSHPGIVQIYDLGEQEGVLYLTLEYVGGGSLSHLLRTEGPMAPERTARLLLQLAQAVQAAHDEGIIHRDLKPSNVLLTENGTPKISDFGLAKLIDQINEDEGAATRLGEALGTPAYMAPEQVRGELDSIEGATDVYGLGTIFYECLTGHRPFRGESSAVAYQIVEQSPPSPRQSRPDVPISLERICLKCLEKDPGNRYAGADDLARALEQFLAGAGRDGPTNDEPVGSDEKPTEGRLTPPTSAEGPRPTARRALWARVIGWFALKRK
jgi:serine/threonine protein kinase